ncbi:hypothetical protein [Amycolatopsis sp. cmx-4-68]|uniref:hypothetical protein n=1 Tax=Amycolatopsis sp. cmx-4-68 TaxID=2790938 RepID=UPI00397E1399
MTRKERRESRHTDSQGRRWIVEVFTLLGPATVLVGLLYYFGYVGTQVFYTHFGVNIGVLNLSPERFLIRNAGTFFQPAAIGVGVAIGLLFAHRVLEWALTRAGRIPARLATGSAGLVCAATAAVGLAGLHAEPLGISAPIWLIASILLFEYAMTLCSKFRILPEELARGDDASRRGLVVALLLVVAFWEVTLVAEARGQEGAELVESGVLFLPQAVVYSDKDLQLPVPPTNATPLAGDNNAYSFRYNGLRQLTYANSRWFLLPIGWRHDNGATVIVLDDDPGHLRVDLAG